jgi:membrane fusion protein (multidrug efflux system)
MATPGWAWSSQYKIVTRAALALVLLLSLAACGKEAEKAKQAAAAPPPPAVVVAEVIQKTVPIYTEFVGRTDARDTVEIRARVEAFLEKQHFAEGDLLKKGQLLFTLDKRDYEAQLQQAKAQLAKAEADLAFAQDQATVESAKANLAVAVAHLGRAETDERRLKPLAQRQAVPQQDYDNAAANLDAARAEVAAKKASLETTIVNQRSALQQARAALEAAKASVVRAELNLSYCSIYSPIDGLIGKTQVDPGNLVGQGGQATVLNTVSSVDPIRVHVSWAEADYLRWMARHKTGESRRKVPLQLITGDGTVHPHEGHVAFADRAVDLKTGTLSIIAEFPNPGGVLRPGQFARVRAAAEEAPNAILVPRRAVQDVQGVKSVLVVGADNMVALRTITPAETVGDLLVVRDGVKPGERVIVDGIQKARPGTAVNPSTGPAEGQAGAKPAEPAQEKAPAKAGDAKAPAKAAEAKSTQKRGK